MYISTIESAIFSVPSFGSRLIVYFSAKRRRRENLDVTVGMHSALWHVGQFVEIEGAAGCGSGIHIVVVGDVFFLDGAKKE